MKTKEPNKTHKEIYENQKVMRWYENNRQGSAISADIWRRNLALYCETMKTDPESILQQAKDKTLEENFEQFRDVMFKKGSKGAYIEKFRQVLRSWTKFNKIDYRINLKIKNANKNETTEDEQVPKPEDVTNLIFKAGPRGRVSISLMAFSGLRPESLGNYLGDDGLVLSDLEDFDLKTLSFRKIPAKINIRSSISKADNKYFTFLNERGCNHVIDYLRKRKEAGEELGPHSPLLQIDLRGAYQYRKSGNEKVKERKSERGFLRTALVTREIRDVIRSAEMDFRPYVLRAYFATALDRAEYNGMISHSWRQFFMGHKGDIERVYSTNKRLLPEQIEEMRESYLKASKFLEPAESITKDDVETLEKSFTARSLKWFGFSEAEIKDMVNLSDDDLQKKIQERRGTSMNNGRRQKVIPLAEVEEFIVQGWEYVNSLPGEKAIVRIPD